MPRYAAVDIGSNSVRMMAAEVTGAQTLILAQERQVTRLGESVFRDGSISSEALDFLCGTLAHMADVYKRLSVIAVRAVATSAVRDASNQEEFLQRTGAALGTSVEIISGAEEARLIHLGVESRWPRSKERTLIIDVGGGSGELIVSQDGQLADAVSKPLGAVRLTELFMRSDPPRPVELQRLQAYIDEKLTPFYRAHGSGKFQRTIVTSATAAAVVSAINQVARSKRDDADRQCVRASQVEEFYSTITRCDLAARRKMTGIGPRRAEIIIAGSAVFLRAIEIFGLKQLCYSAAGVRDGIIADLAGRGGAGELSRLSREQLGVVQEMASRYNVSAKHAEHVAKLSQSLFNSLQNVHKLPAEAGKLLESAAYLHDIGHFVSATGHHKHSAYLVANSDMPNFTDKERTTIAALCRFHRKTLPQPRHSQFQNLEPAGKRTVLNLLPLLRIADALDRGQAQRVQDICGVARDGSVTIEVNADAGADLEIWAATEASKAFREVYNMPIAIQRVKARAV
ncbi:MAG TPA: Ppx/GppA phosphatase family protein [Bryobacteraceae bacterium]|jgi:exopolyphosphatase/guanosine-5'-triphosphate,3'-diphosphate pyrophosphatase|nr:Ppx/GppA phosphatase family protein [Bryobacteraceae bacterium]